MAAWRGIAGGFRGRSNYWRRNALTTKARSRIECMKPWLLAGLNVCGVLGPVGLELGIGNLQIFHRVGVLEDEVIAGAGLEEFLLNGQPRRRVNPHLNFRNLLANVFGLWGEGE